MVNKAGLWTALCGLTLLLGCNSDPEDTDTDANADTAGDSLSLIPRCLGSYEGTYSSSGESPSGDEQGTLHAEIYENYIGVNRLTGWVDRPDGTRLSLMVGGIQDGGSITAYSTYPGAYPFFTIDCLLQPDCSCDGDIYGYDAVDTALVGDFSMTHAAQ